MDENFGERFGLFSLQATLGSLIANAMVCDQQTPCLETGGDQP